MYYTYTVSYERQRDNKVCRCARFLPPAYRVLSRRRRHDAFSWNPRRIFAAFSLANRPAMPSRVYPDRRAPTRARTHVHTYTRTPARFYVPRLFKIRYAEFIFNASSAFRNYMQITRFAIIRARSYNIPRITACVFPTFLSVSIRPL